MESLRDCAHCGGSGICRSGATVRAVAFGLLGSPYFHDVMAFCTTVVGGVIGFYFSSRRDG
jgi:hypothetical protein